MEMLVAVLPWIKSISIDAADSTDHRRNACVLELHQVPEDGCRIAADSLEMSYYLAM